MKLKIFDYKNFPFSKTQIASRALLSSFFLLFLNIYRRIFEFLDHASLLLDWIQLMRVVSHRFDLQNASLPQNEPDLQWPSILLHLILLYIFYSASPTFAHQSALFWLSKKYFIIRMFKLRYFWRLLWTYCQYKCWLEAFQFTFQQFTCLLVSAYFIEKFSQNFFHERVLNSGFQSIVSVFESLLCLCFLI